MFLTAYANACFSIIEVAEGRRSFHTEEFFSLTAESCYLLVLSYSKGYIQSGIVIATLFWVMVSLSGS